MANLDDFKEQAKLLVSWHRAGNYSVGGRIRNLPRYADLTDVEALALKFPFSEAQELVALEAGYESWAALKAGLPTTEKEAHVPAEPVLKAALPMVFVSNVEASAEFFRDKLGFAIDFLHGQPPFYGSVSRGGARLHLRFVHEPVITAGVRERENGLLSALFEVDNVKGLFSEYKAAGVNFDHPFGRSRGEPLHLLCWIRMATAFASWAEAR